MSHEKKTKTETEIEIGAFRFDKNTHELSNADGEIVRMRKQSVDVLAVLVDAAGDIVEKPTLIDKVWKGVATTDDSLVQCIGDIRRTLGRDVVETFPKRGYRFTGAAAPTGPRRIRGVVIGTAMLLVAAVGIASIFDWSDESQVVVPPAVSSEKSLAVLPFANLGPDEGLSFFSNGLSEDISTDLSKVPGLTVISPASSFDFRNAEAGFQKIADDLGVRYLVRGTVRQENDRVRINVSLIDPRSGFNLWAERFDRQMNSVFGLQEEVTVHVVDALSLTLAERDAPLQRVEPDAYFMLLRGVEALRSDAPDANTEAREYFERAVLLDPQYARAHASIALTYGREAGNNPPTSDVSRVSVERGLSAAVTAIQTDPEIPHAYLALGILNLAIREYDNALAAARHAVQLDANYSDGYALLAEIGLFGADLDEALAAIRRAKLLHPHHPAAYDRIEGQILLQLGQFRAALDVLQNSETDADRAALIAAFGYLGEQDEAAQEFRRMSVAPANLLSAINTAPYRFEERRERLAEGLKLAGLIP